MRKFLKNVVYYNPEKAFAGYTLWCAISSPDPDVKSKEIGGEINLMNMDGSIVHTWKTPYIPFTGQLLENGNLLAGLYTDENPNGNRPGVGEYSLGGKQGILMEFDWNGNIVFEHKDLGSHHDYKKLPNGNYIYLVWEKLPDDVVKKVRGGMKGSEHPNNTMWGDIIREVDPKGNIVWEWYAKDHLDYDIDIIGPNYPRHEWSHLNALWICEDGDIMTSSRFIDMAFKISRKTGEIVWRFGNAAYLDKETNTVELRKSPKTFGGQHDVHMIPSGLPGAGNMLCYDNGMYKFVSRAVEVDMKTNEIVWESTNDTMINGHVSFSSYISGARRLPNGNTLICDGQDGRLYEVTKEQEIVWDYYRANKDPYTTSWGIFRCYRYAKDYCPQFKNLPEISKKAIDI